MILKKHCGYLFTLVAFLLSFNFINAQEVKKENKTLELTSAQKPNILVFLVDDMGWLETSVPFYSHQTILNHRYKTPHMAKLAQSSIKFTRAYANPSCSPSRCSFMSGMSAVRHGVTVFTLHKNISPEGKITRNGLSPAIWPLNGLSPVPGIPRTTYCPQGLPKLLSQAGYKTIHVGKAHWGAMGTPGENPLNWGFQVNIAGHAAGGPGSYYGENNYSGQHRHADPAWDVPGLEAYHGKPIFLTEALTQEALKQLDLCKKEKKPFFLYMSHYAVHAPIEADPRFIKNYPNIPAKSADFATLIEGMDKSLGDILFWLEKNKELENTFILFLSDNGAAPINPRNLPLRGCKLTRYEAGTRIPMLVRLPKSMRHNTPAKASESSHFVMAEDLLPTLLEVAGIDKTSVKTTIDGQSWLQAALHPHVSPPSEERPLIWHYPNTHMLNPWSSIRLGEWKLIYDYACRTYELYNLEKDISESKNLIFKEKNQAMTLVQILNHELLSRHALFPQKDGKEVPPPSLISLEHFYQEYGDKKSTPTFGKDQEQATNGQIYEHFDHIFED